MEQVNLLDQDVGFFLCFQFLKWKNHFIQNWQKNQPF